MEKRAHTLYLTDILEAIERVQGYAEGVTPEDFRKNLMVQGAIIRNFEIIGEAAKHIPEEIRRKHPHILREMAGMWDKSAHEYFGVDTEIVWKTAVDRCR